MTILEETVRELEKRVYALEQNSISDNNVKARMEHVEMLHHLGLKLTPECIIRVLRLDKFGITKDDFIQ